MTVPFVYHDDYVTPLPDGHRFPMPKFKLLYDLLIKDGIAKRQHFHRPEIAAYNLLQMAHTSDYIYDFCEGTIAASAIRKIGLPWSPQLVKRTCTAVGGTYLTAKLALEYGLACNLAGGTHHAFPGFGAGFCIFNDMAVAAQALLRESAVQKLMILDLDVHQGDGTAYIFRDEPRVFTFSMHCERNFPFTKQKSDLDISLPARMSDQAYLKILAAHLPGLLETVRPDLIIYDAGVDLHEDDKLGKLSLSTEGIYKRERYVLGLCAQKGIPVAAVIGGGYTRDRSHLTYLHSLLFRAAIKPNGRFPF